MSAPSAGTVLDLLPTACVVVTSRDESGPCGCLVGSIMPIGVDGTTLALALGRASRTARAIAATGRLAVHVLARTDAPLARRLATAPSADRLDEMAWRPGQGGVPVLRCGLVVGEAAVGARLETPEWVIIIATIDAVHPGPSVGLGAAPFTIADARAAGLEAAHADRPW
jgi:flavin reductase (DIM6/NTAB) family NADH-FMN oxidoreductase RutF